MITFALAGIEAGVNILQGIEAKNKAKRSAAISREEYARATLNNMKSITETMDYNYKELSRTSVEKLYNIQASIDKQKSDTNVSLATMGNSIDLGGSSVAKDVKQVISTSESFSMQKFIDNQKSQIENMAYSYSGQANKLMQTQSSTFDQIASARRTGVYNGNAQIISGVLGGVEGYAKTDQGQATVGAIDTKISDWWEGIGDDENGVG